MFSAQQLSIRVPPLGTVQSSGLRRLVAACLKKIVHGAQWLRHLSASARAGEAAALRRRRVDGARSEATSRGFSVLEISADNPMIELLLLRSDRRVAVAGPGFSQRRDAELVMEVADVDAVWVVDGSGLREDPIRIQEIVRRPSAVH